MVDGQVRTTDVTDPAILDAMLAIPREAFVDERPRPLAYIDEDIEIAPRALSDGAVAIRQAGAACRNPPRRNRARCRRRHRLFVGSAVAAGRLAWWRWKAMPRLPIAPAPHLPAWRPTTSQLSPDRSASGHAEAAPYDVILLEGAVEVLPDALFAAARERRPPGRGRRARQCWRGAPLSQIGWHCNRPTGFQCGSKATTRLRTYARLRILGDFHLSYAACIFMLRAIC